MSLKALVVRKDGDRTSRAVETLDDDALPEGEDGEMRLAEEREGALARGERP